MAKVQNPGIRQFLLFKLAFRPQAACFGYMGTLDRVLTKPLHYITEPQERERVNLFQDQTK